MKTTALIPYQIRAALGIGFILPALSALGLLDGTFLSRLYAVALLRLSPG